MTTAELLADLGLNTDLARMVQRVSQDGLPWVVVSSATLTSWQRRDPEGWSKVEAWLVTHGIALIRI